MIRRVLRASDAKTGFALSSAAPLPPPPPFAPQLPAPPNHLERRIGIVEQLCKVRLEPSAGFWRRLQRIGVSAVGIIPHGGGVGGAVALATWKTPRQRTSHNLTHEPREGGEKELTGLHPNNRICQRIPGVGRRPRPKAGANGIAPITPRLLARRLLPTPSLVDDKLGIEPLRREQRAQGIDIPLLIAVRIALRVARARPDGPGIVIRDVTRQSANGGGGPGVLVDAGVQVRGGLEVGLPAEPAGVAHVDVHGDVGEVEFLQGVGDAFPVGGGGVGAFLDAEVGDEVGEAVGFWCRALV